jgi:hypothetical protein
MGNAKQFGPGAVVNAVNAGVASTGTRAQLAAVMGAVAAARAAGAETKGDVAGVASAGSAGSAGSAAAGSVSGAMVPGDWGVSVPQERAIVALAAGRSAIEAAVEAGVSRRTLHRWLREDAAFIAAYNAWRRDATQSARGRMMALTNDAVDSLAAAVRAGDGRLALQLLKSLGLAAAEPEGPVDPQTVLRERELKRLKEESELREKEFFGGIVGVLARDNKRDAESIR